MTPLDAAVGAAMATGALVTLWHTRPRRRAWDAHVEQAMDVVRQRHPVTIRYRCLVCEDARYVEDPIAHTRLWHRDRPAAPEDDEGFLATL